MISKIEELEELIDNLIYEICDCESERCWVFTKYKRPIKKLILEIKDERKNSKN
jgi:hypothetical protein